MAKCPDERESRRYMETAPLLPAETLCLTGLQAVRESRNRSVIVDNFSSICFDLDKAIALPRISATPYKRELFMQITTLLHEAQRSREALSSVNLGSALQLNRLGVFMPAFRARVEERPLTPALIRQTHSGLISYITGLDTHYMQTFRRDINAKKLIASHKAECEVMALLTRTGKPENFAYPAIAREEASHARKQHNHDFYVLRGGRKSAVQVKTSANGAGYKNVAVIQHYDILRAFKTDPVSHQVTWNPRRDHADYEWPSPYRYDQVLTGEAASPLAELLAEEQELGSMMPRDRKNVLNLATGYVLSRMV